jgi:hypothetical protein
MTAWPNSQLTWTLEWTALGPLGNTILAEQFPAIITFHWVDWNFQTNTTNERIFKFLVHLAIHYSLNIVPTIDLMMMMTLILGQIYLSNLFVFLNISSACNLLTCARCCGSVGSCVSIPVLGASMVINVHGDGSLIWKIKLRLIW